MDELREYIGVAGGEEAASRLHGLLQGAGSIVVLATIWPDDWSTLVTDPTHDAPAPHPAARDLLRSLAYRIDIDPNFDLSEVAKGVKSDLRLRLAFESAEGRSRPTQYLAAGVALLEQYSAIRASRIGAWAVLTAAMDAHRLGHPDPLPESFLIAAAPRYIPREIWGSLEGDWLADAFRCLTRPVRGAVSPLTLIRPYPDESQQYVRYQLADYLAQYARTVRMFEFPPESFWAAAEGELQDAAAQVRLGVSAESAGRLRHASTLMRNAVRISEPAGLRHWAFVLWSAGERVAAERCLERAAELGDSSALTDLAGLLHDRAKVEVVYERAAEAGEIEAHRRRARFLWEHGDRSGAEKYYRLAMEGRDAWARWWWAADLDLVQDRDLIIELCEQDAKLAPSHLSLWWSGFLFKLGLQDRAEILLQEKVDGGSTEALWRWAEGILDSDPEHAERLFRKAAEAGDEVAIRRWAGKVANAGDIRRAEDLFMQAAAAGDRTSLWWFACKLWNVGELQRARDFFVMAANAGCWWDVQREWSDLLTETGNREEAERLRRYGLTCAGRIEDPWALSKSAFEGIVHAADE
ncbi:hypothetical protein QLQ12_46430 [Actinoplanes sp. NEAU-A12]|uniref:Tetratricopeptide repeat protein n=1 Tax=Actinoplanes sandaracinus TaxID=3045177 RepID=A0ABT6X1Z9_9ACTN|nr:hypothetical protein [Actinoplanes sandaracinus]MDI6106028.1 hypothetical protein [Actinoplanes sandaracinus]